MSPFAVPIVLFICGAVAVIFAPMARAYAKRMERGADQQIPAHVDQRLERMEQAIDAMAEQIERIAEGQRFTTKLLSERNAARTPELPGGAA